MKNNSLLQLHPLNTDLASFLLRLLFGGLFIYHGYLKIADYNTILNMFPDLLGIGSKLSFNLVIFAEFFCGILVMLGLFTRFTVFPILTTMIVVFFVAHEKDKFMIKELPFVFLFLSLVIFILGSGKYSLDNLLFRRSR